VLHHSGGELGDYSAYPNPTVGAILVSYDEKTGDPYVLGQGRSDYRTDAIRSCIESIPGVDVTPLQEWAVSWPASPSLRRALKISTLYVTLEPSARRQGTALPPITSLIRQVGIKRVVIGCTDPCPEYQLKGCRALHDAGIQVCTNLLHDFSDKSVLDSCLACIDEYSDRANSKLQRMARKHTGK
jgi:diaminohydroxyphosphoribosylaminopyrimidine deaminase / 5-amino-6-(5-phosphoribosylamino)uracil reductase